MNVRKTQTTFYNYQLNIDIAAILMNKFLKCTHIVDDCNAHIIISCFIDLIKYFKCQ